jgi:hypothetical protein
MLPLLSCPGSRLLLHVDKVVRQIKDHFGVAVKWESLVSGTFIMREIDILPWPRPSAAC